MASTHPQVNFAGNLCEDPVLRFTRTGKAVTNLRIACNHAKRPDGSQRDAEFFTVVVWEDLAENIAHLSKGARVIGRGYVTNRSYEVDGQTRWTTEFVATDVGASARWNAVESDFVPRDQRPTSDERQLSSVPPLPPADEDDDEVPFS